MYVHYDAVYGKWCAERLSCFPIRLCTNSPLADAAPGMRWMRARILAEGYRRHRANDRAPQPRRPAGGRFGARSGLHGPDQSVYADHVYRPPEVIGERCQTELGPPLGELAHQEGALVLPLIEPKTPRPRHADRETPGRPEAPASRDSGTRGPSGYTRKELCYAAGHFIPASITSRGTCVQYFGKVRAIDDAIFATSTVVTAWGEMLMLSEAYP
jgi:hypothetical protein